MASQYTSFNKLCGWFTLAAKKPSRCWCSAPVSRAVDGATKGWEAEAETLPPLPRLACSRGRLSEGKAVHPSVCVPPEDRGRTDGCAESKRNESRNVRR